ncbi:DUF2244 domain-containing protein [Paracoccus sp. M683]|uniref:DUF2244 domain-containing protein n=1 Tax=Paracoccus sp. M683 TaxID=2594268 RepID=UPI00117BF03F|nr:DUF2244 domain-containing protein [Paracoccus sp. M683]TRW97707.1 DUF2244 domain-containing protein [Paracoccus sp. M683]
MPYDWRNHDDGSAQLVLWPFRSLPRKGFVWFIGITATLLLMPLIAVLGSAVMWGILPFMALVIWGIWHALQRSYRSGETREVLRMDRNMLALTRSDPGKPDRHWNTNPYWVRPVLRKGPVEDYLTLTDGAREVELGAFLTPEERRMLHDQLLRRLADLR